MTNTRRYAPLALSLVSALLLCLGSLQPARAEDIAVTSTTDVLDAAGSCGAVTIASLPGPDGVTSLREAICAANNNAVADTIQFSIPGCSSGCTIQPAIALPVLTGDDTTIDGYTQDGASPATDTAPATLLVELDGSSIANNNGFNIASSGNVIRGLVINRFPWNGIAIGGSEATDNVISGNYIGTDPSGIHSQDNGLDGVFIGLGAQRNTIGGDGPAERNIIAGNDLVGVGIHGSDTASNTVSGNYIGIAADGQYDCANGFHGVHIFGGSHHNLIGGDSEGERNVISGNTDNGVRIEGEETTGNVVSGNYIGVDATGAVAQPNRGDGVMISAAADNRIGGDSAEKGNVISGNGAHGIDIDGGGSNEIVANFIGLDSSGLAALPNGSHGIRIRDSENNTVGGAAFEEMNFISGNEYGIWIEVEDSSATGNWIHGNAIGMAINGEPLGNSQAGVHMSIGAQQNTVGPGNYIAFNGGDGVGVDTPTAFGNTISQNVIFANGGLGIHLTNGANNGIAVPVILSAPGGPGDVTGTACPGCTVEVFLNEDDEGEGMGYWGSAVADGGGNFVLSVPFLPMPYLTATATDPDDGTSEFSAVFTAEIPVLHEGSDKTVDRETASPGEVLTYTLTLSNTGTAAAAAALTDTLSSKVTWANVYSVSAGTLIWDAANNRVLWSGTVEVDTMVVITFQVRVNAGLSNGEIILNDAMVDDGAGIVVERSAPRVTVVVHYCYLPLVLR